MFKRTELLSSLTNYTIINLSLGLNFECNMISINQNVVNFCTEKIVFIDKYKYNNL